MRSCRLAALLLTMAPWSQAAPTVRPHLQDNHIVVELVPSDRPIAHPELEKRASKFLSDTTAPFAVDGAALPNISWDVGESYAGLLPISDDPHETRKLFFWFFPTTDPTPRVGDEIMIWLNGGPGCTSMEGLMTENGPVNWYPGTSEPTPNPYTWLNLTNMVWIDQPVGVGYSEGEPDIYDETGLAQEFLGFWKNFVKLFCMEEWPTYLAGESYAGVYAAYIADAFIDAGDISYYNLAGVALNSATIGSSDLQINAALPAYATQWSGILGFNATFMNDLVNRADKCQLTSYIQDHLTFPAPDRVFADFNYGNDQWMDHNCNMFDDIAAAARYQNPCLNWYHITDQCPWPSQDVLGTLPAKGIDTASTSDPPQSAWFNQPAVRAALHVPPSNDTWTQCTRTGVFLNKTDGTLMASDPYSVMPAQTDMLSRIIEYTGNVIIGSGGLDMLVPTNGTLLVLQNVTWGEKQGFQQRPDQVFFSPYFDSPNPSAQSMAGVVGTWAEERGLTFYEVAGAGHELPRYAPGPAFRVIEYLLRRITSLSEDGGFTTQRPAASNGRG